MKQQNRAILLEKFITRGVGNEQEIEIIEEFLKRKPDFYCVVIAGFLNVEWEVMEAVTLDLVDFLKKEKISLLENVHNGVSDELFFIERFPSQETDMSDLQSVFEKMITKIRKQYGVVLHIGISATGTGLTNVNKCYEQAKQVLQAQYGNEDECIVKTYDITINQLNENPVTMDFLNRLYTMLICGQRVEAEKELRHIEGCYHRMPFLYEVNKEQIFYSLRNVFYTAVLHLNCKEWKTHIPDYNYTMTCQSMMEEYQKSMAWICEYIQQNKKSKNVDLKEKILQYLNQNYLDSGLCAAVVANAIGISEKYLYQFCKEQTGETFAAILLRLRIDKAIEYLEQTEYSNEQIAALTGFETVNTFYRNFKKVTGVTPKTYKQK